MQFSWNTEHMASASCILNLWPDLWKPNIKAQYRFFSIKHWNTLVVAICPVLTWVKKNLCKKPKSSEKKEGKTWRGIEPKTSHSRLLPPRLCHQATNCSAHIVSILYTSLIEKAFIRRIKKPVLNPTLTLTLVLHAKHNDVFHCLYEGKYLMSLRRSRVGPALPGRSLRSLQP